MMPGSTAPELRHKDRKEARTAAAAETAEKVKDRREEVQDVRGGSAAAADQANSPRKPLHSKDPADWLTMYVNENWRSAAAIDRVIIEVCCSPQSLIGKSANQDDGCLVIRITEAEDFTSKWCRDVIVFTSWYFQTTETPVLNWFSIPCTGGTQWSYLNWAKGSEQTRHKMNQHVKLFETMWESFTAVAPHIRNSGNLMAIEWPKRCRYWAFPQVVAQIQQYGLVPADVDGCAYGLQNRDGRPMRKPWRIYTDCNELAYRLPKQCTCTTTHARVEHADTKRTETYTAQMCREVHRSFREFQHTVGHLEPTIRSVYCAPAHYTTASTQKQQALCDRAGPDVHRDAGETDLQAPRAGSRPAEVDRARQHGEDSMSGARSANDSDQHDNLDSGVMPGEERHE